MTAPIPPEFQAASGTMYDTFARDMRARGMPEAVPFLKDKLAPRHESTLPAGPGYRVVKMKVFSRFTSYSATYPGEELTRDEAVEAASALLKPPADSLLDVAEYDQAAGEPFFIVRWSHKHQGVVVERDYIQALFNGKSKRIFSWSRRWHSVRTEEAPR
jgi:hypothetical protein